MIGRYIQLLKEYARSHEPDFGDGESSVLTLLYETYSKLNRLDNDAIRAGLNELYELMNDMPLREMDRIIYPACTLCRDHEKAGFVAGIKVGVLLQSELTEK